MTWARGVLPCSGRRQHKANESSAGLAIEALRAYSSGFPKSCPETSGVGN